MPQPTYSLLILPFFFIVIFISMKANRINAAALSTYCTTTTCGEKEIRYPFWKFDSTTSTQQCGYPGFGIECSSSNESIIRLSGDDFYVEDMDYASRKLRLVHIDVTTNRNSYRARRNLTLDQDRTPLYLNSSVDFNQNFYFNGTAVVPLPLTYPVACLRPGRNMSYPSLAGNETPRYEFCKEKVVAHVKEMQAARNNAWVRRFSGAMNKGSVLDWSRTMECAKCEISGGHCGFNSENDFLCFCSDHTTSDRCTKGKNGVLKAIIGATVAGIILSACLIIGYCKYREHLDGSSLLLFKSKTIDDQNLEAIIRQYGPLTPRRYSYSGIKKMTNSFRDKLGQGGYGEVYKGYLSDNRPVAVKILKTTEGNGEEFINEVASISRTSHVNVVSLLGFCINGRKRALIYEFLSNGSLEKYIHKESDAQLGLERLYEIAIGIARGLEYLHRGCNTRILHFDIKPHNILLDEDFCPKISDFGLAKLCAKKESIVSMLGARGTIGYIAPEVFCRNFGGVSYKSDVYSYGMMLLEMVGGRKNAVNIGMNNSSETYFPHWIYQRIMLDEDLKLQDHAMSGEENEIARKMIMVGLWCIQTDPLQRPTTSKVIDMLKGSLKDLELPPKPFLRSPSRSESVSLAATTLVPSKGTLSSPSISADSCITST